ncbi:hypothetical protein GGX14DRAFT_391610 [Mycena pura]|uniref:Uncharacterized protein n=1 Tax=Mycena pura TaxID=153505 RepID=A0AAD6VM98_9AGAR|nr:hypothetical protein GGX14DRAFT_391610 [Mycena pura]
MASRAYARGGHYLQHSYWPPCALSGNQIRSFVRVRRFVRSGLSRTIQPSRLHSALVGVRVVVGDTWGVTGTPSMQSQGVAIAEQSQVVVDVTKVVGSVVGVTLESSGGKVEAAASWSGVERVAATAEKPGGSDSGPITY